MAVQIDGSQGNVIATKGTYSGNVTIGGTLTYEDVTNIDAVGIITARSSIEIGARPGVGASISSDGNAIFSGITTITQFGGSPKLTSGQTIKSTGNDGNISIQGGLTYPGGHIKLSGGSGDDDIRFSVSGGSGTLSEKARIDSSGRLLVGATAKRNVLNQNGNSAGDSTTPLLYAEGVSDSKSLTIVSSNTNAHRGSILGLARTRATSVGGNTIVADGDNVGQIVFAANDGVDLLNNVATIRADIDASPGANDTPGRLVFSTTADGANVATERMRLDSAGDLGLGTTPNNMSDARTFHIKGPSGSFAAIRLESAGDTADSNDFVIYKTDTNAYLRVNGTDPFRLYMNGADRLYLTSAGEMGLGTDTIIQKFTIDAGGISIDNGWNVQWGANASRAYIQGEDSSGNNRLLLGTNNTERFRIDSNGFITHKFTYDNSTTADGFFINNMAANTGDNASLAFSTDSGNRKKSAISHVDTGNYGRGDLVFSIDPDADSGELDIVAHEKMRITSGGQLNVGTTVDALGVDTGSAKGVNITGLGRIYLKSNDHSECNIIGGGEAIRFRYGYVDGTTQADAGSIDITGTNSTAYNTSSDYRLKENQVAISDGITRLKLLKPYRFNFKSEPFKTVDGFFAHEVTPAVPEAVTGEKDDENRMQAMDYGRITPLLTAALQEAIAKIETLESEMAALKSS